MQASSHHSIAIALLALLVPTTGLAVVSNINNASTDGAVFDGGSDWGAQGFRTPSYPHKLTSIRVSLENFAGGNSQARIELYSNAGNNLPGASIEDLGVITFGGGQKYSISATGNTLLEANTQYWVVLKFVSGDFNWDVTTNQTTTGPGTLEGFGRFSSNAGGGWGGGPFGGLPGRGERHAAARRDQLRLGPGEYP